MSVIAIVELLNYSLIGVKLIPAHLKTKGVCIRRSYFTTKH